MHNRGHRPHARVNLARRTLTGTLVGGVACAALVLSGTAALASPAAPSTAGNATARSVANAAATAQTWHADLGVQGQSEFNVLHDAGTLHMRDADVHAAAVGGTRGYAMDLLTPHLLAQPAGQVRASFTASVPSGAKLTVEVRGAASAGRWTPWQTVRSDRPVSLGVAAASVQARVELWASPQGAAPTLGALTFSAAAAKKGTNPAGGSVRPAAALSYQVYATREGLVGGTTANGHVIQSYDHFVALPSGSVLSANGGYDYSVTVCGPVACETAPVWDVGPWNTSDDYWDAGRAEFTDLPQGTPEAQAAYENGYNGGRDEFGRSVGNPAGIDLADGTFYNVMGSGGDNGWVTVSYNWTSGGGTPPPSSSWPTVQNGDSGLRVQTVQYLLDAYGYGLNVDGAFGPATLNAVESFQSAHGLTVDGIVGPQTWSALIVRVQQGSSGDAVMALQNELNAYGYGLDVDGAFGPATLNAVESFQSAHGLTVDGIVGPQTWQALV